MLIIFFLLESFDGNIIVRELSIFGLVFDKKKLIKVKLLFFSYLELNLTINKFKMISFGLI